jgi:membrane protein
VRSCQRESDLRNQPDAALDVFERRERSGSCGCGRIKRGVPTVGIVREVWDRQWAHSVERMAAALAYFALLTFAPLLTLMLMIAARFARGNEAADLVATALTRRLGPDVAAVAVQMVSDYLARTSQAGPVAVFAAVFAVAGSIALFRHVVWALHTILEIEQPKGMKGEALWQLVAFVAVAAICAVMLLLVTVLAATATHASSLPTPVRALASWAILSGAFALAYRYLSGARPAWRGVLPGATLTAFVYTLGSVVVGAYLSSGLMASAAGAAGSVLALLVWLEFSAYVFLLGAELSRAIGAGGPPAGV